MSNKTKMTFKRYGSSFHLKIQDAKELEQAANLNEAHWVANNAPLTTINCDSTFLQLIDTDRNGRITCHEVKDAILWLFSVLSDHTGITRRSQVLQLSSINRDSAEGQKIYESVRKMLARLNQDNANQITLEQIRQLKNQVESLPISQAGSILPQAAGNPETSQFISDIITTVGAVAHPNGKQGIGQEQLDKFLADADAYIKWYEQGQTSANQKTAIMPLGPATLTAYQVLTSIRAKIDQYFAQCQAAALDERFIKRMGWTDSELENLDFDDPDALAEVLKKAPIAKADPAGILDFEKPINPYYAELLNKFRQEVILPVLGDCGTRFSASQWQEIKSFFAHHHNWAHSKPANNVEPLGVEKLRKYLAGSFAADVRALIADSVNTALVLDNIRLTEKLILYQTYIIDLVNNFVSFPYLYEPHSRAMFEMGTLVMDGRRFNLAVKVENRQQHTQVAKNSNMYVLYVEVTGGQGDLKFEVAIPVTSGDKGNLCIGKRGVFYDVKGNEFDALVVDIIENPISFKEALSAPFRRIGRLLTGKIEAITSQAEKRLEARASAAMSRVAAESPPAEPAKAHPSAASTAGLLMGAGVAVAALGSAAAYITKTLASVSLLKIATVTFGAIAFLLLAISVVAFLKLRKRDLSSILEGSGWGINARMRLTHKQGKIFTERPKYPKGSRAFT